MRVGDMSISDIDKQILARLKELGGPTREEGENDAILVHLRQMRREVARYASPKRATESDIPDSGTKPNRMSDKLLDEEPGPATGHEAKLLECIRKLQSADNNPTKITYNCETLSSGVSTVDFLRCTERVSYRRIRDWLLRDDYEIGDPVVVPVTDFSKLCSMKETDFQNSEHFQQTFVQCVAAGAADLHAGGKRAYHKPSTTNNAGESVINPTARPDIASLILPLLMEIKTDRGTGPITATDFEVMLQSIERLLALMDVKGFLVRCFCFAITSRSAHLIQWHRKEHLMGDPKVTACYNNLDILHVAPQDISKVWCLLNSVGMMHPDFFLSRDATSLQSSLKAAGVNMQHCRISLVSFRDSSAVYFVTVPDNAGVLQLNTPTFAIKLNYDLIRYAAEAQAHKRIARQYRDAGQRYYVLSVLSCGADGASVHYEALSCTEIALQTLEVQEPLAHVVSWLTHCAGPCTPVGAVIMLPGRSQGPQKQRERDLRRSFLFLDRARVWQTDYRKNNVMFFTQLDAWFIIDMDHALCAEREPLETTFVKGSPRAKVCCCEEVAESAVADGEKVVIMWDDRRETTMFEMLLRRL